MAGYRGQESPAPSKIDVLFLAAPGTSFRWDLYRTVGPDRPASSSDRRNLAL
jgi:hypothetical protein